MEASAIQAPAVVARTRPSLGASMLRLRSDEQLVALFRAGHDEAFRTIHDRYRQRLFAYTRQMLHGRQDAEDALQDVFIRAYSSLRADDRQLALRAWLYRVAHNRCVDELRRPAPPPPEAMQFICSPIQDPIAQADQRESLRRLVADVRRLPAQQRSALLMRELGGMPYADLAEALGVSVPAVKSLLVRARMALSQAVEARETACADIREELIVAHDRRTRPNANARRHLRDCPGCRHFRGQMRGMSRQLAGLVPAIGPLGVAAKMLGLGGGAGGGAAAGSGAAFGGAAAGSGSAAISAGALATGAGHVATLIAATVVAAGGAVEIQHTITQPAAVRHHHRHHARPGGPAAVAAAVALSSGSASGSATAAPAASAPAAATVSSGSATSSSPTTAPLKEIASKAVKKVSSAVSITTKDATKRLKQTAAAGGAGKLTGSSTPASTSAGGSAASSSTAGAGSATGPSSTSTSAGTSGSYATGSSATSPSSDDSATASAATGSGSSGSGASTSGTSPTGSTTS